jgi:hypothetical protein
MDQRNDMEGFFHPNARKLKRSFAERTIDSLDVSDCGSDLGIGRRAKEVSCRSLCIGFVGQDTQNSGPALSTEFQQIFQLRFGNRDELA